MPITQRPGILSQVLRRPFSHLLTCAALLAAPLTLLPGSLRADITITGQETGGDVVFSYSGSVNLTDLRNIGPVYLSSGILPPYGLFSGLGPVAGDGYNFPSGFAVFGSGIFTPITSRAGDDFAVLLQNGFLVVPSGYISNAPLAGTMTFAGVTFNRLGVNPTPFSLALSPSFNLYWFGPPPTPPEQLSAWTSGLPMANGQGPAVIAGSQTVANDINNHLFNLRSGGGEEAEESDGSLSASLDYGVVVGEGDGAESPIAKRIKRSRQWQAFATVNYGNVKLSPISSQAGVQVDSWVSGAGIERHLTRGLTLGFALSFLHSTQTYTGGLGRVELEGPALSTYLSYVRKNFWNSLLYSFGDYDVDSTRNPGFGFPVARGGTRAYTHAVQYNTGYNFRFQNNTLVTGPFAGIDYLHGSLSAYGETGGGLAALSYGKQTFQSLVTRVGWSASKKIDTSWATITPQFSLSYERQNLKNNGTSVSLINAPFTAAGGNQTPGQDYMVAGTGVNFQITPEFNVLLSYQTQIFRNNMEAHFGSVRLGYKF